MTEYYCIVLIAFTYMHLLYFLQDFNDFTPAFHSAIYTASVREDISQGNYYDMSDDFDILPCRSNFINLMSCFSRCIFMIPKIFETVFGIPSVSDYGSVNMNMRVEKWDNQDF